MSDTDFEEESTPMSLDDDRSFVEKNDFLRLEGKVDKLVKALNRLILIEERQSNQTTAQKDLETRLAVLQKAFDELDKKVERWINRGMGAWALAGCVWALAQFFSSKGFIISQIAK